MNIFRTTAAFAAPAATAAAIFTSALAAPIFVIAIVMTLFGTPAHAATDVGCVKQIKDAMIASMDAGPYVITTQVDSPLGDTSSVAEMLPPRGMHSRSEMAGAVTELTVLDGKGWMKYGDAWTAMSPEMVAGMNGMFDGSAMDSFDHLAEAGCPGIAVFNNRPALVYTFTVAVGGQKTATTVHVDIASHLPMQMVSETPSEVGVITVTSTYAYGGDVTIEQPAL